MSDQYTILDSMWFGTIGIVAIKSGDGWKAYIGNGVGVDQKADELSIAESGMPVGKDIAVAAFQGQPADRWMS